MMMSDERIEVVAKAMCRGFGLDPDETIRTTLASMRSYSQMLRDPDADEVEMTFVEAVVPRWRTWRWQAELALVSRQATDAA